MATNSRDTYALSLKRVENMLEVYRNRLLELEKRTEDLITKNRSLEKKLSQSGLAPQEADIIKTAVLAALNAVLPRLGAKQGVPAKTAADKKTESNQTPKLKKTFAEVLITSAKEDPAVTLSRSRVDPKKTGIQTWRKLGRNAMSVRFEDAEKKAEFVKSLPQMGLEYKGEPVKRPYVIRVHALPMDATLVQVKAAIADLLKNSEYEVQVARYRTRQDCQMAVIETNERNFNELKKAKTISINWQKCRIDTKPVLMKCRKCLMLGHTANHCKGLDDRLKVIRPDIQCLDCTYYNIMCTETGRPKSQQRKVTHPTGDKKCKTMKVHLKRYVAARKRPETTIPVNIERMEVQEAVTISDDEDEFRTGGSEKITPIKEILLPKPLKDEAWYEEVDGSEEETEKELPPRDQTDGAKSSSPETPELESASPDSIRRALERAVKRNKSAVTSTSPKSPKSPSKRLEKLLEEAATEKSHIEGTVCCECGQTGLPDRSEFQNAEDWELENAHRNGRRPRAVCLAIAAKCRRCEQVTCRRCSDRTADEMLEKYKGKFPRYVFHECKECNKEGISRTFKEVALNEEEIAAAGIVRRKKRLTKEQADQLEMMECAGAYDTSEEEEDA